MFTLNCRGRLLAPERPIVMGIINCTPDSFYPGSRASAIDAALERAGQMLAEGATILDIGGQSTRPGSNPISAIEEIDRISGPITAIHKQFPDAILSVDTYVAEVAAAALEAGASMINDISGGADPDMVKVLAGSRVPYVLMHMKGTPQTMQGEAQYDDVTTEVLSYLARKVVELQAAGINDIVIDPGFGFAKTIEHNFQLLRELETFRAIGRPLLAGISRKSTVYRTLDIEPKDALNGSTVLHTVALLNGADIIRTHDVKEAVEAIVLLERGHFRAG